MPPREQNSFTRLDTTPAQQRHGSTTTQRCTTATRHRLSSLYGTAAAQPGAPARHSTAGLRAAAARRTQSPPPYRRTSRTGRLRPISADAAAAAAVGRYIYPARSELRPSAALATAVSVMSAADTAVTAEQTADTDSRRHRGRRSRHADGNLLLSGY